MKEEADLRDKKQSERFLWFANSKT